MVKECNERIQIFVARQLELEARIKQLSDEIIKLNFNLNYMAKEKLEVVNREMKAVEAAAELRTKYHEVRLALDCVDSHIQSANRKVQEAEQKLEK